MNRSNPHSKPPNKPAAKEMYGLENYVNSEWWVMELSRTSAFCPNGGLRGIQNCLGIVREYSGNYRNKFWESLMCYEIIQKFSAYPQGSISELFGNSKRGSKNYQGFVCNSIMVGHRIIKKFHVYSQGWARGGSEMSGGCKGIFQKL